MRKRKSLCEDSEKREVKKSKSLEDAKKFIERTGSTIKEAAAHFQVGRNSLGVFMKYGFQKPGWPPILNCDEIINLRAYLCSLDTAHLQQSVPEASKIIQKISALPAKPSDPTVLKYIHEAGLRIRTVRSADKGRMHVIESIEDFVHYYDILEEKLDQIHHDPIEFSM